MNPLKPESGSTCQRPLLRRMDQAVVAVLILAALVSMTAYWLVQGGPNSRLIEVERAERQTIQFAVDINEADWPELTQLPGIGETLARRIVESRSVDGAFADHEALERVRGIGPKTLERIKPFLRPVPASGNVAGP